MIIDQLNVSVSYKFSNVYGNTIDDGLVGFLHQGLVDCTASSLSLTTDRMKWLDYVPNNIDWETIVYKKQAIQPLHAFISVFSQDYWIAYFGMMILLTVIIFCYLTYQSRRNRSNYRRNTSIHSIFWTSLALNFGASWNIDLSHLIHQKHMFSKILVTSIFVSGFLNFSAYEGGLISQLMAKTHLEFHMIG